MTQIKDILTDVSKITKGLNIGMIKVSGDTKTTDFKSSSEDNKIMMSAKAKTVISEFEGVFGLGSLNVLRGYLDIYNSYGTDTPVTVTVESTERNGIKFLSDISFKAKGQSAAVYRLTSEAALKKTAIFNGGITWDVELANIPKAKIQEFARFAGVLGSVESYVAVSTKDYRVIFSIGEENAAVSRVQIDMGETAGQLKSSYKYPIAEFLNLLNNSNPVLKFSSKGVAQIMIDSGLIDYEFTLPGAN